MIDHLDTTKGLLPIGGYYIFFMDSLDSLDFSNVSATHGLLLLWRKASLLLSENDVVEHLLIQFFNGLAHGTTCVA